PECAWSPSTVTTYLLAAQLAVTSPIAVPAFSRRRPCSMWISAQKAALGPSPSPRNPVGASASPTETPALSVTASAVSSGSTPVYTLLPISDGAKREPSSLNQFTTARLYRGGVPLSDHSSASRNAACA